ncbi:glucose-1-phosphate adenylyltransferase family protein [Chloroflexota bacterium]
MENAMAVILAGGYGDRLGILAQERAKPALPFGGKYRIIDFTLSNCANSDIRNVAVLTQYRPMSLADHIGIGAPWGYGTPTRVLRLLQQYQARGEKREWYRGTADAVFQNLAAVEEQAVDHLFVLSGDHIYKMDYQLMLAQHIERQADVTLALAEVPEQDLPRFGTVEMDEIGRITKFQEKVKKPRSNLANMGIYLFNMSVLKEWLSDAARTNKFDFGRNIFSKKAGSTGMFGYVFNGYWRDVGTIPSYWQASMEILETGNEYLQSGDWPLRTNESKNYPPSAFGEEARVVNSLISEGCRINGRVENSVISPGVCIGEGAKVLDSVIMENVVICPDVHISRAILDKEVVVGQGSSVGFGYDFSPNREEEQELDSGLTIVGKRAHIPANIKIGHNCVIYAGVDEDQFKKPEVPSGETIKPRRRRKPKASSH